MAGNGLTLPPQAPPCVANPGAPGTPSAGVSDGVRPASPRASGIPGSSAPCPCD